MLVFEVKSGSNLGSNPGSNPGSNLGLRLHALAARRFKSVLEFRPKWFEGYFATGPWGRAGLDFAVLLSLHISTIWAFAMDRFHMLRCAFAAQRSDDTFA